MASLQRNFLSCYYAAQVDKLLQVYEESRCLEGGINYAPWEGVAHVLRNDFASAQSILQVESCNLGSYTKHGYENLALLALLLSNLNVAQTVLDAGLERYPASAILHARRGFLDVQLGLFEESYARYRASLAIEIQIPILLQFLDIYRWRDDEVHRKFCCELVLKALAGFEALTDWVSESVRASWRGLSLIHI